MEVGKEIRPDDKKRGGGAAGGGGTVGGDQGRRGDGLPVAGGCWADGGGCWGWLGRVDDAGRWGNDPAVIRRYLISY